MQMHPEPGFALGRAITFDVEVYPRNRWCVGFYGPGPDGTMVDFTVNSARHNRCDLDVVLQGLRRRNKILCGYNSTEYDVPIVRVILDGQDPYEASQAIV